jgi:electron transfer flavoprotein alpha/beta subunit
MGQSSSREKVQVVDSANILLPIDKHNILDVKLNKKYNHIVFGGTGTTAGFYGQLGAVIELMNQSYFTNVKTITSAGPTCILALLLALGYNVDEIKYFYQQQDFNELYTAKKELQSDICHFAVNLSRNNGQELSNVITDLIEKRTGNKNYTLGDLFSDRKFALNLVITDLTTQSHVILNHLNHANVPLRLATRIACGYVPQIAPVIYDEHYFTGAHDMTNIVHRLMAHDPHVLTIDAVEERSEEDNHSIPSLFDLIEIMNKFNTQPPIACDICKLQRIVVKTKDTDFNVSKKMQNKLIADAAVEVYNWK